MDLVAECRKRSIGLREGINELPKFAFGSSVMTRPFYSIRVRGSGSIAKYVDGVEEGVKTDVSCGEPRRVFIKCQRPRGDRDHHDKVAGTREAGSL